MRSGSHEQFYLALRRTVSATPSGVTQHSGLSHAAQSVIYESLLYKDLHVRALCLSLEGKTVNRMRYLRVYLAKKRPRR